MFSTLHSPASGLLLFKGSWLRPQHQTHSFSHRVPIEARTAARVMAAVQTEVQGGVSALLMSSEAGGGGWCRARCGARPGAGTGQEGLEEMAEGQELDVWFQDGGREQRVLRVCVRAHDVIQSSLFPLPHTHARTPYPLLAYIPRTTGN